MFRIVALRQLLGWSSIVVGLLGCILPIIPGMPFLIAGVMLVGRRHPVLRRLAVALKLQVRSLARRPGVRGQLGRYGRQMERELARQFNCAEGWLNRAT